LTVPQALQKRVIQIDNKNANALDGIEKTILKCLSGVSICTAVLVKQVLCVVLVNRTNTDNFSNTKYEMPRQVFGAFPAACVTGVGAHESPGTARGARTRTARVGGGTEGEDKDKKTDAPKHKHDISSVSSERKAGAHFPSFTSARVRILTRIPREQHRPAYLLALLVQKYKY
jgi:hypothetical protein